MVGDHLELFFFPWIFLSFFAPIFLIILHLVIKVGKKSLSFYGDLLDQGKHDLLFARYERAGLLFSLSERAVVILLDLGMMSDGI